jgi:hypothetical protein
MQVYRLKRYLISNKAILGVLNDSQNNEICKTLENPFLDNKPYISSIPCGIYHCKEFNGVKYQNVWEILNVPGRSSILFHNGNISKHTEGCILVGQTYGFIKNDIAVLNSQTTLTFLQRTLPKEFILEISNIEE